MPSVKEEIENQICAKAAIDRRLGVLRYLPPELSIDSIFEHRSRICVTFDGEVDSLLKVLPPSAATFQLDDGISFVEPRPGPLDWNAPIFAVYLNISPVRGGVIWFHHAPDGTVIEVLVKGKSLPSVPGYELKQLPHQTLMVRKRIARAPVAFYKSPRELALENHANPGARATNAKMGSLAEVQQAAEAAGLQQVLTAVREFEDLYLARMANRVQASVLTDWLQERTKLPVRVYDAPLRYASDIGYTLRLELWGARTQFGLKVPPLIDSNGFDWNFPAVYQYEENEGQFNF